ncbi:MAG: GlxA family transcriptional regulator [Granulosicoccaceae bacterium]
MTAPPGVRTLTSVEILLLPKTTLILASNLIEPLRAANRLLAQEHFRWQLSSIDGEAVTTTSGMQLAVDGAFDPRGDRETPLLIAASYGGPALCTPALRRQLVAAAHHRPLIGAADGGVVLLAEAGLLKGRRAAFHTEDVDTLSPTYTDVVLSAARWVIDRDRATARGAAPALEMMLALIARWRDKSVAEGVARLFDYPLKDVVEDGVQTPLPWSVQDDLVSQAMRAMNEHLQDPLSVEQLASVVGCPRRSLHARFSRELRMSPQQCYVQLRLGRARQLILETDWPVADIAGRCGYGSSASFARAFRAQYGHAPTRVRAKPI